MTPEFDCFVGVDWSGAKGQSLPGFRVAMCHPGDSTPQLVANPAGGHWSRPAFVTWLEAQGKEGRVLCGMDFSFCFPFCDVGDYFPGLDFASSPSEFW